MNYDFLYLRLIKRAGQARTVGQQFFVAKQKCIFFKLAEIKMTDSFI